MKRSINSFFFLQISLALMFIALGILGINSFNSGGAEFMRGMSKTFGGNSDFIPILMAIIELVAGALLLVSLFAPIPEKLMSLLLLIIFIFWAVNIVLLFIVDGLFEPNFIQWPAEISPQLVILTSLWIVYRNGE